MNHGRVYMWVRDAGHPLGGYVQQSIEALPRLEKNGTAPAVLGGQFVRVRNGGAITTVNEATGSRELALIGDALPNAKGDFIFEPGHGGGRMDKVLVADAASQASYIEAARFGEVNTYFHLDRIAYYIHGLLADLGAKPLPRVTAIVNAHHAATEEDGVRDGVRRGDSWVAFQGGHYRLSDWCYDVLERQPVSPDGEIHLGPGRQWLDYGALAEAAGGRYLANGSHNAGILYHEYGHHITRHTADFRANAFRRGGRQSNRKIATDEGTCDYWTAAMLEIPHIWAWHRRHDAEQIHPRSLVSTKTMAEFDYSADADPHANGTIWAATLWDLRAQLARSHEDGARKADRLVLKALLLIGSMVGDGNSTTVESIMKAREGFDVGLAAMLRADAALYGSQHSPLILETFAKRGILPAQIRMPA